MASVWLLFSNIFCIPIDDFWSSWRIQLKEQGNGMFRSETQNILQDTSGRGHIQNKHPNLIIIRF